MPRAALTLLVVVLLALPALPAAAQPGARPPVEERGVARVGDKININTAGVPELMTLDGVGRRVAEAIVQYRQQHGPFKRPEEVRRVSGIGAGLWERNRDRIVVE